MTEVVVGEQKMLRNGRITRRPRFPFATMFQPDQIQPVNYCPVIPGETMVNQSLTMRLVTEPVKNVLNPAYFDVFTFYVPYRIALGELWEDFVKGENIVLNQAYPAYDYVNKPAEATGATATQTNRTFGFLNNTGGTARNTLIERCADVVFNTWFLYENEPDTAFAYGAFPTQAYGKTASTDQLAETSAIAALPSTTVPVTGAQGSESFLVADLRRQEAVYRRELNVSYAQPEYADVMSAYGVDFPAELITEPELLFKRRSFLYPSRSVGQNNGNIVGQFMHDVDVNMDKPYMFREHGLVMTFVAFRPVVFQEKYNPLVSTWKTQEHFMPPYADQFIQQLGAKEWHGNPNYDHLDLCAYYHQGETQTFMENTTAPYTVQAVGTGDPRKPDYPIADFWDFANFQWGLSSDPNANKFALACCLTGVTAYRIKTRIPKPVTNRTMENNRRG